MAEEGERISFTTKELLAKLEDALGSKIDQVGEKVDLVTNKHESEIRDVRHRVANLEAAQQLRRTLEAATEKNAERILLDLDTLKDNITELKTESASQHAVDAFKKWVVGTVVLGFGAFVLAIIQMFQTPN